MQSPDGKKFSIRKRAQSFRFAFRGIASVFCSQHNFRIHCAAFLLVIAAGLFFGITPLEWCLVLLASALVFSFEIINTAMEMMVDMVSPDYNEKAGRIKDLAAAAVLVSAMIAAVTGLIIFGRYILEVFKT